jgi:hypothetical protein
MNLSSRLSRLEALAQELQPRAESIHLAAKVVKDNPEFTKRFTRVMEEINRRARELGIEPPKDRQAKIDMILQVLCSDRSLAERALPVFAEARKLADAARSPRGRGKGEAQKKAAKARP